MAFVIKEHRPGRVWLLLCLLALAWAGSGWWLYQMGQDRAGLENARSEQEKIRSEQMVMAMQVKIASLEEENRTLHARISVLERTAQVDQEARRELSRTMQKMQQQEAALKEKLAFYQGIVAPEKGKEGLNVHELQVRPAGGSAYHYTLMLTQAGKNASLAKGVVKISFSGILQGKEKTVSYADIVVAGPSELVYGFQYFQDIKGSFQLPDGFSPRTVEVGLEATGKGSKNKKLVRVFEWPAVIVEEEET